MSELSKAVVFKGDLAKLIEKEAKADNRNFSNMVRYLVIQQLKIRVGNKLNKKKDEPYKFTPRPR